MSIKRALVAWRNVILALAFCGVSAANAVTIEQYDSVKTEYQSDFLIAQKATIDESYIKNGQLDKHQCMERLENIITATGESKLDYLIRKEIRKARADTNNTYHVEDIIAGVTEHECSKPVTEQIQTPEIQQPE